jgi:hypothetical protein
MPTLTTNTNTTGFLSSNFLHNPPRLYVTAESDDFDEVTLQDWRAEGFNVAYVPLRDGGKEYAQRETFAIVGM